MNPLPDVYGDLLIVRAPVPATLNKAGANYKSEVAHLEYSPRRAFDEWLSICDAIVACGGDALYQFEDVDDPLLDHSALEVDGDGNIRPAGSSEMIESIGNISTGRVFAANGPWVTIEDGAELRALLPNMLVHRRDEIAYYVDILGVIAHESELRFAYAENPHRWEGMADVATVGDRVVLTYAVPGHYDDGLEPKSSRSSREGVEYAARWAGVPDAARVFAELVYPHFHGDTVHFGLRPTNGPPMLAHYAKGLWGDSAAIVAREIGDDRILAIGADDAVEHYAGNSRQVGSGVLVPDGVSAQYVADIERHGLVTHRVPLFELFGKAGGGPACATLYVPRTLRLPQTSRLRYSQSRDVAHARRERIPESLRVDPDYFAGKSRG
jgi:hypothetical protein